MNSIMTILKGNLRKSKGVYVSIFILMCIISVALSTVITYTINSKTRDQEVMSENGFGDMLAWMNGEKQLQQIGMSQDAVIQSLKDNAAVQEVNVSDAVYAMLKECNGKDNNSSMMVLSDRDENLHYTQYDAGEHVITRSLKKGEISVPVSFYGLYNCKIGDMVTIGDTKESYSYRVASYFEDPYLGSALIGVKAVLLSQEDMDSLQNRVDEQLKKYPDEQDFALEKGKVLNIFRNQEKDLSALQFEQKINEDSNYAVCCWLSLSREQASGYMLLLSNVFAAMLFIFIVLLLIVTLIVLSHNIGSSIELNTTNIGILKATGMADGDLRLALLIGYLSVVVVGVATGIPLSVPVVRYINHLTLPTSGLYVSDQLSMGQIVLVMVGILLFVVCFIIAKTAKLSQITPMKAIGNGMDSVHFSSLLQLPISQKALNLSLAYRQFTSEKRQYIAAIMVTMILTAFMVMTSALAQWFNSPQMIIRMFSITSYDIAAEYENADIQKQAEEIIARHSTYEKYRQFSQYLLLDNLQMYCYIIDDPNQIQSIREGRTCLYDNEILITQYLADQYKVGIGDELEVKKDSMSRKMLISGIYESANDVGKNFAMNYEAYKKFKQNQQGSKDGSISGVCYQLENPLASDDILQEMKDTFGENSKVYTIRLADDDFSGVEKTVAIAVTGFTILIYLLGSVFVMVTVAIVCGKVIVREQKDYGIYKALGFVSTTLRIQLAVRFAITAAAGSILGVLLASVVSGPFFRAAFQSFGIYSFESHMDVVSALTPITFMIVLFAVCAYVRSGKIRKVEPRILISE